MKIPKVAKIILITIFTIDYAFIGFKMLAAWRLGHRFDDRSTDLKDLSDYASDSGFNLIIKENGLVSWMHSDGVQSKQNDGSLILVFDHPSAILRLVCGKLDSHSLSFSIINNSKENGVLVSLIDNQNKSSTFQLHSVGNSEFAFSSIHKMQPQSGKVKNVNGVGFLKLNPEIGKIYHYFENSHIVIDHKPLSPVEEVFTAAYLYNRKLGFSVISRSAKYFSPAISSEEIDKAIVNSDAPVLNYNLDSDGFFSQGKLSPSDIIKKLQTMTAMNLVIPSIVNRPLTVDDVWLTQDTRYGIIYFDQFKGIATWRGQKFFHFKVLTIRRLTGAVTFDDDYVEAKSGLL